MSSITPVSYQATYIPVTPVRPVAYGGSRATASASVSDQTSDVQLSAAKRPGQGQIVDIKV